jgi:hypothetical protein
MALIRAVFPGTAIYVYGVLPSKAAVMHTSNNDQRVENTTMITFMLDDQPSGPGYSSTLLDLGSEQFKYNVPVFTITGLTNEWHKLDISVPATGEGGGANGFLFDYAKYT